MESPFITLVAYGGGRMAFTEEGSMGSLNSPCSFLFYLHIYKNRSLTRTHC